MSKPTIIITGANGFIGECLVKHFFDLGWSVRALVHSMPKEKLSEVNYIQYSLEKTPESFVFENADFLVHCAYLRFEKNANADQINLQGTKIVLSLCRQHQVKPLFISSFSAHEMAQSHYGKTKLACEKLFDLSTDVVLKPGFVIGKKGMGAELIARIKNATFFPLVGGGNQPIQTVWYNDLCLVIQKAFEKKLSGLFYIAEPTPITMHAFYLEIAGQLHKKIHFVELPVPLLFAVCKMAETIGIKLPVSSESVLGLKHLTTFDTSADLNKLGITLKNYRESLQLLLK